jgi:hypothetical protein
MYFPPEESFPSSKPLPLNVENGELFKAQLSVSEETVRSHAKSILEKLNQHNRAQAMLAAMRIGLIKLVEK